MNLVMIALAWVLNMVQMLIYRSLFPFVCGPIFYPAYPSNPSTMLVACHSLLVSDYDTLQTGVTIVYTHRRPRPGYITPPTIDPPRVHTLALRVRHLHTLSNLFSRVRASRSALHLDRVSAVTLDINFAFVHK